VRVDTPKLYHFFEDTNTQIIQYIADSKDLKAHFLAEPVSKDQAKALGRALGLWAHQFHAWGASPEQSELRTVIEGNTNATWLKFFVNYGRLDETIARFPKILESSREIFQQVCTELKARLANKEAKDLTIIHGDFWSGK
jgi:fructosamine-3-kinase